MANEILAVSSRPSNPVSQLTRLIYAALEGRSRLSDDFSIDYKQQLRTLVGLSYAVVMTEGSKVKSFRPCLATFLRYNNLIHQHDKFEQLSAAIAEIICNAISSFKILGFPRYYDDFLLAMTHAVSPSDCVSANVKNGMQGILLDLLEK